MLIPVSFFNVYSGENQPASIPITNGLTAILQFLVGTLPLSADPGKFFSS
jgi:hypothetical protein